MGRFRLLSQQAAKHRGRLLQYAALPYRVTDDFDLEIMLITSRNSRRWITPKGWPKPGRSPRRTAEEEAFEEAGIVGKIGKKDVGFYTYSKMLKGGATANCVVRVFPLRVSQQRPRWPEKGQRRTSWYGPGDAANLVREPSLRRVRRFARRTRPKRKAGPAGSRTSAGEKVSSITEP